MELESSESIKRRRRQGLELVHNRERQTQRLSLVLGEGALAEHTELSAVPTPPELPYDWAEDKGYTSQFEVDPDSRAHHPDQAS